MFTRRHIDVLVCVARILIPTLNLLLYYIVSILFFLEKVTVVPIARMSTVTELPSVIVLHSYPG